MQIRVPTVELVKNLQRDLSQSQNKGRQVVLAGTQPAKRAEVKNQFDSI